MCVQRGWRHLSRRGCSDARCDLPASRAISRNLVLSPAISYASLREIWDGTAHLAPGVFPGS